MSKLGWMWPPDATATCHRLWVLRRPGHADVLYADGQQAVSVLVKNRWRGSRIMDPDGGIILSMGPPVSDA